MTMSYILLFKLCGIESTSHWCGVCSLSNPEALWFIKAKKKLNSRHADQISYLEKFSFVIQRKVDSSNKVANTLSRRYNLLTTLSCEIIGFNLLPKYYVADPFFS